MPGSTDRTTERRSSGHLHDGEDYELLFTARGTPPIGYCIGTVEGADILLVSAHTTPGLLEPKGWNHSL